MVIRYVGPNAREFLSDAIVRGDLEAVRNSLVGEMDLETVSSYGLTPLMEAAGSGRTAVARYLLSNGANVNACGKRGVTALMLAASRCRPDVVALLLRRGASMESMTAGNKTALDFAAAAGDWASMRLLIKARAGRRRRRERVLV